MYFENEADSLRGILSHGAYYLGGGVSPGHIVSGQVVSVAGCLRGGLSPGQFVSGADCLRGRLSPGTLSQRRIVSGHIVSGHIVSRVDCLGAPCPHTKILHLN